MTRAFSSASPQFSSEPSRPSIYLLRSWMERNEGVVDDDLSECLRLAIDCIATNAFAHDSQITSNLSAIFHPFFMQHPRQYELRELLAQHNWTDSGFRDPLSMDQKDSLLAALLDMQQREPPPTRYEVPLHLPEPSSPHPALWLVASSSSARGLCCCLTVCDERTCVLMFRPPSLMIAFLRSR